MQDKCLVSIIIPVYNVENYLKKCIESCLNQTISNIEVIAIDDGSTDNSSLILDKLAKKHKNLRVVHKKNGGVSSARNLGVELSCGEYLTFVDGDDYLANDAIEYMLKIIKETSSEFAILKNCFTEVGQVQANEAIKVIDNESAVVLLLGLSMELGCWNKMYSKEMLERENIKFDDSLFYGEGLDFILNVSQHANGIVLGNKRVYYYRKNNLASATSSFNYKKFENGEKSLMKVKKNLIIDSKKINDIWMYHYAMFALNVVISCIKNKSNLKEFKIIFREWKNKFNLYFKKLIVSKNISIKEKIKLIIFYLSPYLFSYIRCKKVSKVIKRSV